MALQHTWDVAARQRAQEYAEPMRLQWEDGLAEQVRELEVGPAPHESGPAKEASPARLSPRVLGLQTPVSEQACDQVMANPQGEDTRNTSEAWAHAQKSMDSEALLCESHASGAPCVSGPRPQVRDHTRRAQWLAVFNIRTRDGVEPRYEADALLAAAEALSKRMRSCVTMPDISHTNATVHGSQG